MQVALIISFCRSMSDWICSRFYIHQISQNFTRMVALCLCALAWSDGHTLLAFVLKFHISQLSYLQPVQNVITFSMCTVDQDLHYYTAYVFCSVFNLNRVQVHLEQGRCHMTLNSSSAHSRERPAVYFRTRRCSHIP